MAGSTLSSRILAAAAMKSPATINCTNSLTFTPTGQSVVQTRLGALQTALRFLPRQFLGIAQIDFREIAWRATAEAAPACAAGAPSCALCRGTGLPNLLDGCLVVSVNGLLLAARMLRSVRRERVSICDSASRWKSSIDFVRRRDTSHCAARARRNRRGARRTRGHRRRRIRSCLPPARGSRRTCRCRRS